MAQRSRKSLANNESSIKNVKSINERSSATFTERFYYLDAARAVMLLLGIPFHASEIYRISGGFIIESPDKSYSASLLSGMIHVFRMPAFFLLSGYFASLLLKRQDPQTWLKGRLWKLGIPLVATTVLLGFIENGLAYSYNNNETFVESVKLALKDPLYEWIHHRWFLVVLIMYCITAYLIVKLRIINLDKAMPTIQRSWKNKLCFIVLLSLIPFISILSGKIIGEWTISSPALKSYSNLYTKYLVFFVVGYLIEHWQRGMENFVKFDKDDVVLAILSIAVYMLTYFAFYSEGRAYTPNVANDLYRICRIAIECLAGYYAAKAFFKLMFKIMNYRSLVIAYFVEASFCIYLVHEVFLIFSGGLLSSMNLDPFFEITLISLFTLVCSILIFEVVKRSRFLSLIFNGGRIKPVYVVPRLS